MAAAEILFWDLPPAERLCNMAAAVVNALAAQTNNRFGTALVHRSSGNDESAPRTVYSAVSRAGSADTERTQSLKLVAAAIVQLSPVQMVGFATELQTIEKDPSNPYIVQDLVERIWELIRNRRPSSQKSSQAILKRQASNMEASIKAGLAPMENQLILTSFSSRPKILPKLGIVVGWTALDALIAIAKAGANEEAQLAGNPLPYPDFAIPSVTEEGFLESLVARYIPETRQGFCTDGRLDMAKFLQICRKSR